MKHIEYNDMNTIRILAVAPYQGLRDILEREVRDYPDIQLDAVTGNLEEGVNLAQKNFHANYDILISRGGTASLLRQRVSLPVIEIDISLTDILQAINLSNVSHGKRAIVGFPSITSRARELVDLLSLDIEIYTLSEASEIFEILEHLKKEQFQTIICDVISSVTARNAGFDTILITSGKESVRKALIEAQREVQLRRDMRQENVFLRHLISEHSGETVVFLEDGTLFFSTLQNSQSELIGILRDNIADVKDGIVTRITKSLDGYHYLIKANPFQIGDKLFIAYYFSRSRTGGGSRMAGISYSTHNEIRRCMENSFFFLSGELNSISSSLQVMTETSRPLLIMGEYGTGRSEAAMDYFLQYKSVTQSYIDIDMQILNDKSRDFLINHPKSPLFYTGNMIHLKNLGFVTDSFLSDLFHTLIHAETCTGNKVIFSGNPSHPIMKKYIRFIKDIFVCLEVELSPLRYNAERIPTMANLYLSHMNASGKTDVLRIDNQAFRSLTAYQWPGNYTQFERVLNQMFTVSKDHLVHAEEVNEILRMEQNEENVHTASSNYLNLNRPLADIEKEIVETVIHEKNGNQSAAAKQLGISRTTLWRMMQ